MTGRPVSSPTAARGDEYHLDIEPPRCPRCGYDLRGLMTLSGARCPECGRRLAFDELRFPDPKYTRDVSITIAVLAAPPVFLIGAKLLWLLGRGDGGLLDIDLIAAALGAGAIGLLGVLLLIHLLWPRLDLRWKVMLVGVAAINLVFSGWWMFAVFLGLVEFILASRVWRWWRQRG